MGGPLQSGSIDRSLIDEVSGAQVSIEYSHHEAHEGDHYFIKNWQSVVGAANSFIYLMFRTPSNGKRIHAKASITVEAEYVVEIFEEAVVSADGTPIASRNNDRDQSDDSFLKAFAGPTVTDEGDSIWSTKIGSGKNDTVSPGVNYEIIAKTDSNYLFKLTKVPATEHWIALDFWWYEHTPSA